ncbi:hypothetical protein FOA52_010211 [Chlamydomonas sp. UWO 241]|nr:hypothetical protein FOA52_010211 [Chlamydomonas sp. UWO 241]
MFFTIHRNVGGVQGLDLAINALSEKLERHLFESPDLFSPAAGRSATTSPSASLTSTTIRRTRPTSTATAYF